MRAFPAFVVASLVGLSPTAAFAASGNTDLGSPPAGLWRISQLTGVSILDPSHITVGRIADVLLSRDGQAQYVVIGFGGLAGFDEKDVTVPFSDVHFTSRPIEPPPNPVATSSTGASAGTPGGNAAAGFSDPATVLDGAERPPHSVGHPDHGTIDMTVDQLKQIRGLPGSG